MVEAITRRKIIAALAVAGASTAIGVAATSATTAENIDSLWRQYTALVVEAKATSRAIEQAEANLPEWARPGPWRVDWEGKFSGREVGWPIRKDLTYPDHDILRLARPGPFEISDWFEEAVSKWPWRREIERARYRKNMRNFVKRVREQRLEKERVGLPGLLDADEGNYDRRWEIREAISALPPSDNSVAALLLLNLDEAIDIEVLSHLRPRLTGLIAEHAALVVERRCVDHKDLPFVV